MGTKERVGRRVGIIDGFNVGLVDGFVVGFNDGVVVGEIVGSGESQLDVGTNVGESEGVDVGRRVGIIEGLNVVVGDLVWVWVGEREGCGVSQKTKAGETVGKDKIDG